MSAYHTYFQLCLSLTMLRGSYAYIQYKANGHPLWYASFKDTTVLMVQGAGTTVLMGCLCCWHNLRIVQLAREERKVSLPGNPFRSPTKMLAQPPLPPLWLIFSNIKPVATSSHDQNYYTHTIRNAYNRYIKRSTRAYFSLYLRVSRACHLKNLNGYWHPRSLQNSFDRHTRIIWCGQNAGGGWGGVGEGGFKGSFLGYFN